MATPPAPAWLVAAPGDGEVRLSWAPIQGRLTFESGLPAGTDHGGDGPTTISWPDAATGTTMALQLADLGDYSSVYAQFPVTMGAPGSMSIRYAHQTEQNYDFVTIWVDAVQQYRSSGDSGGYQTLTTAPLAAGTHTVRIDYAKDSSASSGFDNIRIGSIAYPVALSDFEYRINGGSPVSVGSGSATEILITGLTNGQVYSFEVRGVNADGPGPWTSTASATPVDMGDVLLQDNFDRTASTSSVGNPTYGGPYTVRSGTWGIIANQLYTSASAVSQLTFPGAQDMMVEADFMNTGSTGGNGMSLMIRWVDANNHWMFGRRVTGAVALMRCIGGTYYAYSPDMPVVDGQRLGVAAFGKQIFCFINDKLVVQADDPWAGTTATVAGVRIASATTARLDNLQAELIRARPGSLPEGSLAEIIEDFEASELQIPTFVYKGRDKRSADEGAVA